MNVWNCAKFSLLLYFLPHFRSNLFQVPSRSTNQTVILSTWCSSQMISGAIQWWPRTDFVRPELRIVVHPKGKKSGYFGVVLFVQLGMESVAESDWLPCQNTGDVTGISSESARRLLSIDLFVESRRSGLALFTNPRRLDFSSFCSRNFISCFFVLFFSLSPPTHSRRTRWFWNRRTSTIASPRAKAR